MLLKKSPIFCNELQTIEGNKDCEKLLLHQFMNAGNLRDIIVNIFSFVGISTDTNTGSYA